MLIINNLLSKIKTFCPKILEDKDCNLFINRKAFTMVEMLVSKSGNRG